jgi:hypothetical protein
MAFLCVFSEESSKTTQKHREHPISKAPFYQKAELLTKRLMGKKPVSCHFFLRFFLFLFIGSRELKNTTGTGFKTKPGNLNNQQKTKGKYIYMIRRLHVGKSLFFFLAIY